MLALFLVVSVGVLVVLFLCSTFFNHTWESKMTKTVGIVIILSPRHLTSPCELCSTFLSDAPRCAVSSLLVGLNGTITVFVIIPKKQSQKVVVALFVLNIF